MPLQDHFHPPLSVRRHWHAFHNAWATFLASALNQHLPKGYFAESNVQFGIEIDVAAFDEGDSFLQGSAANGGSHPALATPVLAGWQAPAPTQVALFQPTTDSVEVQIFDSSAGPTLVGAIELVSPANKDRGSQRRAFIAKCETYLRRGIGLMIVDIVTIRRANLHNELMRRLSIAAETPFQANLYATGYRAIKIGDEPNLEIWREALKVGKSLPVMPLYLHNFLCIPVDLETTYERTISEHRIS